MSNPANAASTGPWPLSRLPRGQAQAVWLAAFYGHTAQQVAASEGIPLVTAKSRIG